MIHTAGGVSLLCDPGKPSPHVTWEQIAEAAPEVIVFSPCGYYLAEAEEEAAALYDLPAFAETPAARGGDVFAVDATSYFSRPGPRIVDGLEILAWAVHPEAFPEPAADRVVRVRRG
jgi:iron complex transport system substrate-binding protein